jgi:hypothetical protein
MPFHTTKPFRKSLRVAVLAPRADLGAATDGVPRGVRPFDMGIIGQSGLEQCWIRAVFQNLIPELMRPIIPRKQREIVEW